MLLYTEGPVDASSIEAFAEFGRAGPPHTLTLNSVTHTGRASRYVAGQLVRRRDVQALAKTGGHPLNPVHTSFVFELAEDRITTDCQDQFLDLLGIPPFASLLRCSSAAAAPLQGTTGGAVASCEVQKHSFCFVFH